MNLKKYFYLNKKNSCALILAAILLFLTIKIPNLAFKFSDENIYFYMGEMILKGQLPYQDFFFASPPIQIFLIGFFLLFFGEKIILLKLLPLLAVGISCFFIFLISKKIFNKHYGIISSILYLFSVVILTTTDHFTGIHFTSMFLTISFYLLLRKQYFFSALFSSFALLTRIYAIFAIFGILIFLCFKNKESFLKYLIYLTALFGTLNLTFIALFKTSYLSSVYLYHLLKSQGIPKINVFSFFIKTNIILVLSSITALFFKDKRLKPFYLIVLTTLLFYIFYSDIYYLYFGLFMPFLSIIAAHGIYKLFEKINRKKTLVFITIFLILFIILNSVFYLKNHSSTAKITFTKDLANYIQKNSNKSEKIYGSFEIVPLIALISDREIAGNYIDTNEKTFLTGLYNIENRTRNIQNKTKFIILKVALGPKENIIKQENIIDKNFLKNNCNLTRTYLIKKDYSDNAVVVFKC